MNALLLISVFGLFHPRDVEVRPAPGASLSVATASGITRVRDRIRFTLDSELPARVHSPAGALVLSVPGRAERRFTGSLEITGTSGELRLLLSMRMEDAVAAAVAAEGQGSEESMKVLAVVARSWYAGSLSRHTTFDYCDTTHCQYLKEPDARSLAAASATRDLILQWQRRPVAALYSSSCGGRTLTAAGVGMPSDGYPYFQVECEPCRRQSVQWERRLFGADAAAVLSAPYSEAVRLNIARRLGWDALPGNNYQLLREPGSLLLRGAGRGHGVGLCQSGAARMAASGVPFASVLAYYFPNTLISRQRR